MYPFLDGEFGEYGFLGKLKEEAFKIQETSDGCVESLPEGNGWRNTMPLTYFIYEVDEKAAAVPFIGKGRVRTGTFGPCIEVKRVPLLTVLGRALKPTLPIGGHAP